MRIIKGQQTMTLPVVQTVTPAVAFSALLLHTEKN